MSDDYKILKLKSDTFDARYARLTGNNVFTGINTTNGRRKAVTTKTADYTATANNEVIKFTSNATLTLPSATGTGQHYLVRAVGCTVVIDGSGTETINEELTQTITNESVQIIDEASGLWGAY